MFSSIHHNCCCKICLEEIFPPSLVVAANWTILYSKLTYPNSSTPFVMSPFTPFACFAITSSPVATTLKQRQSDDFEGGHQYQYRGRLQRRKSYSSYNAFFVLERVKILRQYAIGNDAGAMSLSLLATILLSFLGQKDMNVCSIVIESLSIQLSCYVPTSMMPNPLFQYCSRQIYTTVRPHPSKELVVMCGRQS